jgi:hypothetical protein
MHHSACALQMLAPGTREQADPREDRARELSRRLRADRSAAKDLAELSVRWVVVLHEADATLERSGPTRWARPAAYGWMRGLSAAGSTENGLVQLPAGGGLLWCWPTTIVLLADVLTLTGVVVCIARGRRGRVQRARSHDSQ